MTVTELLSNGCVQIDWKDEDTLMNIADEWGLSLTSIDSYLIPKIVITVEGKDVEFRFSIQGINVSIS